jgi:hypothetical protein
MRHLHHFLLCLAALEILLLGYSIGLRHDEIHWVLFLWDSCLIATTASAAAIAYRVRYIWQGPRSTEIIETIMQSRPATTRPGAPPIGQVGLRPTAINQRRS